MAPRRGRTCPDRERAKRAGAKRPEPVSGSASVAWTDEARCERSERERGGKATGKPARRRGGKLKRLDVVPHGPEVVGHGDVVLLPVEQVGEVRRQRRARPDGRLDGVGELGR